MPSPGRVAIAGAIALSCLAAPAAAQAPRYTRAPKLKVEVQLSERTRPKVRPATVEDPGPRVRGEDILAAEAVVRDLREEQIRLLEALLEDTPASEPIEQADIRFRIADSYGQLSRFHRLEGVARQIAADQTQVGADQRRLRAEARTHAHAAATHRAKALAAYGDLVDERAYRAYPNMAAALFAYGFTLQQGDAAARTRAREVYHRLLTEFPHSRFVPHAYLAFADYFFEARDLANAASFYGKVLQFPASNVYGYARYMLGWVYVNQGRHEDAGREFLTVVRDTSGRPAQDPLRRAALQDFVRAFSEFGDVRKAWAMLQKIDAASAPAMYARLADLYVEQGKSDKAIFALRQLIKAEPGSPALCAWQHAIAVAMLSATGATAGQKVDEIERLAQLATALARRPALPAAALRECRADAAAMSGELARAYHSEASKTRDGALAALADRLYAANLAAFPDAADAGETRYYRAELAWMRADQERAPRVATERWAEAAAAFTAVVHAGGVDRATLAEAAAAAVDGWRNALAVDPRPTLVPVAYAAGTGGRALPPPRPLPARVQAMVAAIDDYLTYIPDPGDARRVAMTFVKANTLRQHDHLAAALPAFEQLVEAHPEHETALYAANIVLDLHILAGRHDRVAAWGRWFVAHPGFFTARPDQDRGALRDRVAEVNLIAARLEAEALERTARRSARLADFVACGDAYLAIFNAAVARAPRAGVAGQLDEVLYNAGVCYEDGRSLSAAIDVYTQLRERFPTAKTAARALARLGNVYARVAFYDRASDSFEEYARRYAGEADARRAMNDAVLFRRGLGDDARAIADTEFFVATFGRGPQAAAAAADATFSLATIFEKRGDLDAVVAHYRRYLATYGEQGGGDRVVVAYARIGEILWQQSCPVTAVDGACVQIRRARAAGSRARKRTRGDVTRTQCGPDTKIKLTVVRRDAKKVAAAMAAFGQAMAAYERRGGTFPGGDARLARHAYGTAAFHQAELAYERFLAVPFPTGLDFDPGKPAARKASDAKLAAWFSRKDALGSAAGAGYVRLFADIKDPATAIAGAARLAQIAQIFSDALYTAEVPAFIRPYDEAVDAYCGRLEEIAAPYEARSVEGFGTCLDVSTRAGWFSSWSRLCERELGQIKPDAFPVALELRAAPDALAAATDVERPVSALP